MAKPPPALLSAIATFLTEVKYLDAAREVFASTQTFFDWEFFEKCIKGAEWSEAHRYIWRYLNFAPAAAESTRLLNKLLAEIGDHAASVRLNGAAHPTPSRSEEGAGKSTAWLAKWKEILTHVLPMTRPKSTVNLVEMFEQFARSPMDATALSSPPQMQSSVPSSVSHPESDSEPPNGDDMLPPPPSVAPPSVAPPSRSAAPPLRLSREVTLLYLPFMREGEAPGEAQEAKRRRASGKRPSRAPTASASLSAINTDALSSSNQSISPPAPPAVSIPVRLVRSTSPVTPAGPLARSTSPTAPLALPLARSTSPVAPAARAPTPPLPSPPRLVDPLRTSVAPPQALRPVRCLQILRHSTSRCLAIAIGPQGQAYSLHVDGHLYGPELSALVPFSVTPVGLVVLMHRWVVVADVRHLYIYVSGRDTAVMTKKLERNIAVVGADTTEDTNLLYVGTDDGYVLQFEHGTTGICSLAVCGNLFAYANKAGEVCVLDEAKHQRCLLDGQGMSDGHLVLCRMYFVNSEELVVVTPVSARKFKLGNPFCLLAFSAPQGSQFTAAQLSRDEKHLLVCIKDTVCVVSTKTFALACCTEHLLGSGVRGLALAGDTANARRFTVGASDGSVQLLTWDD